LNRSLWWVAVAALLALPALVTGVGASRAIDWQPSLATSEAWRWWSAAWVHYSRMHLVLNLAGAVLVAVLGIAAPVGRRAALAWLLAWPLTHLGLLLKPELAHYGGLSGVLHAGVAVIAVELLCTGQPGRARWMGLVIAAALIAKVLSESPWGPPLRHPPQWDIAVAPLAHATGLVAGALCALIMQRRRTETQ
jgi:rhomboid family GlyGly-CTERM serine protease